MNKIELLEKRRKEILLKSKKIREKIAEIIDEDSFVELSGYSFSKNDLYGSEIAGEGVITGYATIDGCPVYLVAQNAEEFYGGISLASCKKISACIDKAIKAGSPVIYLFDSYGVQVGEGVNVLEGVAGVLSRSAELKGVAPQIALVVGKLYGSLSLVATNCDACFTLKGAEVCYASPLVVSAGDKKSSPEKVAGINNSAFSNVVSAEVEDMADAKERICDFLGMVLGEPESDDDFNRTSEDLNDKVTAESLIKATFDEGKFFELSPSFASDVKVGLASLGNTSVAAIVFDGGEKGVELTDREVKKVKDFAVFASNNALPLITFVNTLGIKEDVKTNSSTVLKDICDLVTALKDCRRISVVYKKAIGLGYTLFASKSLGTEYSYAFATAKVALFDGDASSVAFGEVRQDKLAEFAEKYAEENADPINAAKNGYIDDIIEPAFVRPYLISALQTMLY